MSLSYRKLGAALGISYSRAWELAQEGMPTDSVEAAIAWREANLDPAWEAKPPPPPPSPVERTLCEVAPPLLWRPELFALALREAGINAIGEQVLRMAEVYVLVAMDRINQALKTEGQFAVGHIPAAGSPEAAELVARLNAILNERGQGSLF